MKTICLCVAILVFVGQAKAETDDLQFLPKESEIHSEMFVQKAWDAFKTQFTKNYSGMEEEQKRKLIFMDNLKTIEEHNYRYKMGLTTYDMGINQFSDMEFSEVMEANGYLEYNDTDHDDIENDEESSSSFEDEALPRYVDWRNKGYVTRVKNQGNCGSCWAFSATGALEGQTKRKTGRLVSLSEQNLIDCSKGYGNNGCHGGWMPYAFRYIRRNRGIDSEASYPYEAKEGACRYKRAYRAATVRGFVEIRSGSEWSLTRAIARVGPIAVAINVRDSFQHYRSGIYQDNKCSKTKLNHAVLAVGYGKRRFGSAFYIIKNSWGTTWGDNGYILMARNKRNMCGIASGASYPRV